MADRDEVLNRLCALVTNVGVNVFHSEVSHDCFCPSGAPVKFHSVAAPVLAFIENAVQDHINASKQIQAAAVRLQERSRDLGHR